jgi:hypothetical protein
MILAPKAESWNDRYLRNRDARCRRKSQLNWPEAEEFRLCVAELPRELAAASLTPRIKRYV